MSFPWDGNRLEQDDGAQNVKYFIAVLEQFGIRVRVPGFIYSGPMVAVINQPGNAMGTVGFRETKVPAGLDELGDLKLKFCER
jgi:hypothetical protein